MITNNIKFGKNDNLNTYLTKVIKRKIRDKLNEHKIKYIELKKKIIYPLNSIEIYNNKYDIDIIHEGIKIEITDRFIKQSKDIINKNNINTITIEKPSYFGIYIRKKFLEYHELYLHKITKRDEFDFYDLMNELNIQPKYIRMCLIFYLFTTLYNIKLYNINNV